MIGILTRIWRRRRRRHLRSIRDQLGFLNEHYLPVAEPHTQPLCLCQQINAFYGCGDAATDLPPALGVKDAIDEMHRVAQLFDELELPYVMAAQLPSDSIEAAYNIKPHGTDTRILNAWYDIS